jgi:hypothetical protein
MPDFLNPCKYVPTVRTAEDPDEFVRIIDRLFTEPTSGRYQTTTIRYVILLTTPHVRYHLSGKFCRHLIQAFFHRLSYSQY